MKIRHTFLFTLLSSNILLLVLVLGFIGLNFKHSLMAFFEERTQKDFAPVITLLLESYQQQNSWQQWQGQQRMLMDIIEANTLNKSRYKMAQHQPRITAGYLPKLSSSQHRPPPRRHPPHRNGSRPPKNGSGFSLLDTNKHVITHQNTLKEPLLLRISNSSGQLIGYLAIPNERQWINDEGLVFLRHQVWTFSFIVLSALLVAFLIALALSRYFAKPIEKINAQAEQLIQGDYHPQTAHYRNDELGNINHKLDDLAQVLAHTETSRKNLFADISHELRTPIAIVRGEIEALQDGIRPLTKEAMISLQHEILHLQKLVEDLYTLSNDDLDSLSYFKEPIRCADFLSQCAEKHRPFFEAQQLRLHYVNCSNDLFVIADEHRLSQVLDNVLTNSLKYTDPNGMVVLYSQVDGDNLLIQIEDSAPGVTDAALPLLFNHLYRAENSRNKQLGGAGLGLSICQRIIEAHSGTIDVEHSSLGGILITIKLPLEPSHE